MQQPSTNNRTSKTKVLIALLVLLMLATAVAWLVVQRDEARNQQAQETGGTSEMTDAERFARDYPAVSSEHPFVSTSPDDTLAIFNEGTGLVYLGFTECPWCQAVVPLIEEAADKEGLDTVPYLNIRSARQANDTTYQRLVAILEPYLDKDEKGSPRIYVPDISAVKDGQIVARFEMEDAPDEDMAGGPASYWTDARKNRAVMQLQSMIEKTQ